MSRMRAITPVGADSSAWSHCQTMLDMTCCPSDRAHLALSKAQAVEDANASLAFNSYAYDRNVLEAFFVPRDAAELKSVLRGGFAALPPKRSLMFSLYATAPLPDVLEKANLPSDMLLCKVAVGSSLSRNLADLEALAAQPLPVPYDSVYCPSPAVPASAAAAAAQAESAAAHPDAPDYAAKQLVAKQPTIDGWDTELLCRFSDHYIVISHSAALPVYLCSFHHSTAPRNRLANAAMVQELLGDGTEIHPGSGGGLPHLLDGRQGAFAAGMGSLSGSGISAAVDPSRLAKAEGVINEEISMLAATSDTLQSQMQGLVDVLSSSEASAVDKATKLKLDMVACLEMHMANTECGEALKMQMARALGFLHRFIELVDHRRRGASSREDFVAEWAQLDTVRMKVFEEVDRIQNKTLPEAWSSLSLPTLPQERRLVEALDTLKERDGEVDESREENLRLKQQLRDKSALIEALTEQVELLSKKR